MYVTSNNLLWICTITKGADFILPGGDNSSVVIIHALGPFFVIPTNEGAERVVTNHQCLPTSQYKGALPYVNAVKFQGCYLM